MATLYGFPLAFNPAKVGGVCAKALAMRPTHGRPRVMILQEDHLGQMDVAAMAQAHRTNLP